MVVDGDMLIVTTERPSNDGIGGATCARYTEISAAGTSEGPTGKPSGFNVMIAATTRGGANVTAIISEASRNNEENLTLNICVGSCRTTPVIASSPCLAVTRSTSAELRRHQQGQQLKAGESAPTQKEEGNELLPPSHEVDMATSTPDPRGIPQDFGDATYAPPLSYDGLRPGHYRPIAAISWFSRTAVQADAENDSEQPALYAWDGQLY